VLQYCRLAAALLPCRCPAAALPPPLRLPAVLAKMTSCSHEAVAVETNPAASSRRKRVYFIRHAHSRYNEWRDRSWLPWAGCAGLCIGDPLIYDAALSERGEAQLYDLRNRVQELGLHETVELVVTTPLTRAIQTAVGAFDLAQLKRRGVAVVASGIHLEACDTTCDLGTPLSELRSTFRDSVSWETSVGIDGLPIGSGGGGGGGGGGRASTISAAESEPEPEPEPVNPAQGGEQELWWYGCATPRNGARRAEGSAWRSGSWSCRRLPCCRRCCPPLIDTETQEEVQERIAHFTRWISDRPERVIVVVGHSSFFRQLIRTQAGPQNKNFRKLRNCEIFDCESVSLWCHEGEDV
jgi:broad specificity phosphatase PhoE